MLTQYIFLILPPNFLKDFTMNYLKQFVIPFTGLKFGVHQYEFVIDDQFFDALDYSMFKKGSLKVGLELNRQERMLIFDITISGDVERDCDRCLDPISYPVESTHKLIFKFGEDWEDLSDEIVIIPESEYEINMAHYLYEFICLALPMQCVHPDDKNGVSTCNPEMLKLLGYHPESHEVDPRWEALKKLKNK